MMQQNILLPLLDRYLTGDLSAGERKDLAILIKDPENREVLQEFVKQVMTSGQYDEAHDPLIKKRLDNFIDKNIRTKTTTAQVRTISFFRTAAFRYAAAMIVLFTAVFYFIGHKKNTQETTINKMRAPQPAIFPGGNKAMLTLADGTTIALDSASNGSVAQQGNIKIIKLEAGHLAYSGNASLQEGETSGYNTIVTPRGGQYQVILGDGTHVWLNAASSVRFPASFSRGERRVEITGEAYLEVAKDNKRPFFVKAGPQNIEVLGTGFNINAYEDEGAVKTTLVEGAVKVTHNNEDHLLEPGKQAMAEKNGTLKILTADVNRETAWKNGLFQFAGADLKSVMRQLARWYDVRIVYPAQVPQMKFTGEIQRNLNLEDVLQILKDSEVDLKLEGRILTILS